MAKAGFFVCDSHAIFHFCLSEIHSEWDLGLFQPVTEGFIQRHLVRSTSQKSVTKAALDTRKLFLKKSNTRIQLWNNTNVTDEIVREKKIKSKHSPKVSQ